MSLAAPCDSGYEDTCTITCADGHSVSGIPNATCTADASWTAFGECVDTDGCIGSACAAGSVCRDLPADEHVGTSSLPYACDCRGGKWGTKAGTLATIRVARDERNGAFLFVLSLFPLYRFYV